MEENKKLSLDELENVVGGYESTEGDGVEATHYCPVCEKNTTFIVFLGGRGRCKKCGHKEYDF